MLAFELLNGDRSDVPLVSLVEVVQIAALDHVIDPGAVHMGARDQEVPKVVVLKSFPGPPVFLELLVGLLNVTKVLVVQEPVGLLLGPVGVVSSLSGRLGAIPRPDHPDHERLLPFRESFHNIAGR